MGFTIHFNFPGFDFDIIKLTRVSPNLAPTGAIRRGGVHVSLKCFFIQLVLWLRCFLSILYQHIQYVKNEMTGSRIPGSFYPYHGNDQNNFDEGTLCRASSPVPGSVGLAAHKAGYSYSISGTTGALGSMLFTETDRLPGTWYDRTAMTTMFRTKEAALGRSKYADKDFRKSAKRTLRNIRAPSRVDVDIHFETKDRVEDILVRGRRGTRSFRFDFDAVEASQKKLPKDANVLKPFLDTIAEILAAVIQVR